jgi:hypothetical protein
MSYRLLFFLGAARGLIVGAITEALFKYYYYWEWRRSDEYATQTGLEIHVDRTSLTHNRFVIPLLYIGGFTVVTYLLGVALRRQTISAMLFWQLTAVVGVTSVFLLYFSEVLYVDFRYLAQPGARHHLIGMGWTWLACVLLGCFVSALMAVFYDHWCRK